jgi:acetylornithine deacetylase/succinyl-diaminopimelate desuccinylase-like protein
MGKSKRTAIAAAALSLLASGTDAQTLRPDQARFRDIYKELVETDTSLSVGSCTLAAQKMAARLKTAGFTDADLHLFTAAGHPKEGGLVAVLPGSDPRAKAILLLAHLDVVEAKREDWTRDPFTLVEEDGYFYGRGTADDKAEAAIFTDMLARFRSEGFHPRRTVKMALTCGEETAGAFNGAQYLATHERTLIDAAFALNEGGWGRLDEQGKHIALNINAGEKFPQNFRLEVTNVGGHSMRPVKDNAIYHLSAGLLKIGSYDFPVQTTDATLEYFRKMGPQIGDEMGAAMQAFARDPKDAAAIAVLAGDPAYNAMLRTTCVATMLDGGHATNALPQRARANVNCRIFPGTAVEQLRGKLDELVGDPAVKITAMEARSEIARAAPPLTPAILDPVLEAAGKLWPGVPVIPALEIGATDAAFLTPAGIPTYGFTGMFFDPDGSRLHGLNERVRTRVVYEGRDFLTMVVKRYAQMK